MVPICGGGVAISTLAQIGGLVAPIARLVALVGAAVAFLIAIYAILTFLVRNLPVLCHFMPYKKVAGASG